MTLGDRVVVMEGGLVQQCDSPLNIYNRPLNRFVAGFLGTPPMNFLDGTLAQDGDAVCFDGQGLRLRLCDAHAPRVRARLGQQVVLGLRPEHLSLDPQGPSHQTMTVKVSVTEPLGSAMDVHALTPQGSKIVARVKAEAQAVAAEQLTLYVDMPQCHVFEPGDLGANLTLAPNGH